MKPAVLRFVLFGLLIGTCVSARAAVCAGQALCQETAAFVVSLGDFRTSKQGSYRIATATLSFQNKSSAPIILGYVKDSAVAIDELGNRYAASGSNDVRGIGLIERNTFDPKFTLQPGERSDARIELRWYAANAAAGVNFDLDLVVREIEALPGQQYRLGKEHALRFSRLSDGAGARAVAAAPLAVPAAAAAGAGAAPVDACGGSPRCVSNGPIALEIIRVVAAQDRSNHLVRVTFRARNLTQDRVFLGYLERSGVLLDNYGNRYTVDWRSRENVQGIGQVSRDKADAQFALQPGEGRSFTLQYSRYAGKTAIGTIYSPDVVLAQLEILPSQQVRLTRELTFNFSNLTTGSFGGGDTLDAVQSINEAGRKLSEGFRSIFKKKD